MEMVAAAEGVGDEWMSWRNQWGVRMMVVERDDDDGEGGRDDDDG